jgi:hypothetical protein
MGVVVSEGPRWEEAEGPSPRRSVSQPRSKGICHHLAIEDLKISKNNFKTNQNDGSKIQRCDDDALS